MDIFEYIDRVKANFDKQPEPRYNMKKYFMGGSVTTPKRGLVDGPGSYSKDLKYGSLTDTYNMLVNQWNDDVLKAYKAKDLSTLETSFADYAGKELNISNKKVNSQYYGLKKYNKLEGKILDVVEFRKNLAKELITEANQGIKIVRLPEIASKLGPNYTNATLKTLISRIPEIPELDTYEIKVNKAFQKIFVDVDPEKVLAKDFFDPAKKIHDAVGPGAELRGGSGEPRGRRPETKGPRVRTDTIYKALKNNPDYKDLGFEKIFNRLRLKNFQEIVLKSDKPWNLSDVFYAVDNNLNLKNPKSIDERAINFAIRSKIQGNPNIEIFSREGDRLVKLDNPKSAQINNYYDIVFKMDGKNYGLVGDIPGVINLQKDGRQLPEFKNFYEKAAAKDELAKRTKFPDGTDIINPRTGKLSTFENLMKDTYYFGRGKKKGFAMAFPYDLEHLDIKNDPFGIIKPQNLRILPSRINRSVGDRTKMSEDVIKKTGYFFEKDLPFDQQINNMMNRERALSQKVLKFDEEGNHIGRRLDTAGAAAKKQIQTRGLNLVNVVNVDDKKLTKYLKKMGYRCPKNTGGVAGDDLECFLNDVRKTKEDIRSSNPEVRSKAIVKQRNALKQAKRIPQVARALRAAATGSLVGGYKFIGGFPGLILEGLIEFAGFDYYKQKGYDDKQAAAEGTFIAKKLGFGDLKPGEGRGFLEGAETLLQKELVGGDPAKQKYFDIKDAMDQKASELETLNRELKTLKSGARGYGGGDDFEIFDKEEEIKRAVEEYIKLENTIKPGTPLYQSYQTGLEKQEAIQEARREEERKSSYLTGLPETEMTKENRERNLALRREREMKQFPPMSMDDFADNIFTDDHLEGIQNAYKDPTITKKDMLDVFRQKEEFNKGLFQGIFEQADKSSAGQERLLGTQGEFSSGGIASGPPPKKGPQSQGLAYFMKNGKR